MIDWSVQRRVTVVMPTWIGDVCMATPTLSLLRDAMPSGGHITVALRERMEPLVAGLSTVDQVAQVSPRGLTGPWRAGRAIAATRPDAILILPGSFRAALAAWCSRASHRVGYARDRRGWLLTDAVAQPDRTLPVSTIDWYAALVSAEPPPPPHLIVTDLDAAAMAALFRADATYCLLIPGANRQDKRWPAAHFVAVANAVHAQYGWTTVIAGSPGERALTEHITRACQGPAIDMAAMGGSLSALKACVAGAEVVVSNDTGPRHIALALGTPVVSLFGPTDHRWTIAPTATEVRLLSEPFLPESVMADRHAATCDINRISVPDVLHAIDQLASGPNQ